jgi:hypothetical protein
MLEINEGVEPTFCYELQRQADERYEIADQCYFEASVS